MLPPAFQCKNTPLRQPVIRRETLYLYFSQETFKYLLQLTLLSWVILGERNVFYYDRMISHEFNLIWKRI